MTEDVAELKVTKPLITLPKNFVGPVPGNSVFAEVVSLGGDEFRWFIRKGRSNEVTEFHRQAQEIASALDRLSAQEWSEEDEALAKRLRAFGGADPRVDGRHDPLGLALHEAADRLASRRSAPSGEAEELLKTARVYQREFDAWKVGKQPIDAVLPVSNALSLACLAYGRSLEALEAE